MTADLQRPFDVGVVVATVARPTLGTAVRSIFAQRFDGRIHVLIGIDRWAGDRDTVERLRAERPAHVALTVLDLGYSTSQRNGGVYPSHYGGALKTILSFAANSRFVTYLDDDNWYTPGHVESLVAATMGKTWGFALRTFVDAASGDVLCDDTWESLGPDRGVYAETQGGFVDTNCFCLDALACSDVFPEWAMTRFAGGTGGDRQVLARLRSRPWSTSGVHSVFYRTTLESQHPYLLWQFKCAGVELARYMPTHAIPGDAVWAQCAAHDRARETAWSDGAAGA
ncbi:MAG: hypothetical protein ABI533_10025 [Betaproteobacteria bacterium]